MEAIILAGGSSSRMGRDKALLFDSVQRLQLMLMPLVDRVTVLCGVEERTSLFKGHVMPDPKPNMGLHQLIEWYRSICEDDVMLLPCDAYLLTESGVDLLLQSREQGGVIWQHNRMQSVFATIPQRWSAPVNTTSLTEYLASMPRIHVHDHDSNYFHFNSTEEIELHVQKIMLLQEKFHHSQSHR